MNLRRVLVPLFLCFAFLAAASAPAQARTYLPCNPSYDVVSIKVKPRHCTILPSSASYAEGANLGKLRWKHWGEKRAYFTGISKGFHRPIRPVRVHGFAFRARPDLCGGKTMLFTRVRIKGPFGGGIVETQDCVGFD